MCWKGRFLCGGAFPCAMRGEHEMLCEEGMSEQLHYQLTNQLISALNVVGEVYDPIQMKNLLW